MRLFSILIISSLSLVSISFGQKLVPGVKNEKIGSLIKTDSVPTEWTFNCRVVETEAIFEKGPGEWEKYLRENLNNDVPQNNGCPPGRYKVRINFSVDKEGEVIMIKATTNHGYGMEDEATRITSGSPKWTPATRNGRKVKAYRFQIIIFDVCGSAMLL